MTKDDAPAIAAHCQAQVASDEFDARMKAAYAIVRDIPEYQQMAAMLLALGGVTLRPETMHLDVVVSAQEIAAIALTCIACGFAFGEDFGETKYISKGIPA